MNQPERRTNAGLSRAVILTVIASALALGALTWIVSRTTILATDRGMCVVECGQLRHDLRATEALIAQRLNFFGGFIRLRGVTQSWDQPWEAEHQWPHRWERRSSCPDISDPFDFRNFDDACVAVKLLQQPSDLILSPDQELRHSDHFSRREKLETWAQWFLDQHYSSAELKSFEGDSRTETLRKLLWRHASSWVLLRETMVEQAKELHELLSRVRTALAKVQELRGELRGELTSNSSSRGMDEAISQIRSLSDEESVCAGLATREDFQQTEISAENARSRLKAGGDRLLKLVYFVTGLRD